MKVYVTKYALTEGIKTVECDEQTPMDAASGYAWKGCTLFTRKNWHVTAEAAILQAEKMRARKIALLEKQLHCISAMTFTVPK